MTGVVYFLWHDGGFAMIPRSEVRFAARSGMDLHVWLSNYGNSLLKLPIQNSDQLDQMLLSLREPVDVDITWRELTADGDEWVRTDTRPT